MGFWKKKKTKAKPRPMRQIRQMVEEGVGLEFIVLDDEGEVTSNGRCKVHGYEDGGHCFIIDMPTERGRSLQVLEGEPAQILFELNSVSSKFNTRVIESFIYSPEGEAPFAALKIQAPESLESGSKRNHFRVEPLRTSLPEIKWRPLIQKSAAEEEVVDEKEEVDEDEKEVVEEGAWTAATLKDVSARGLGLLMSPKEAARLHPIYDRKIWPPLALDILPEKVEKLRVHTMIELSVLLPESEDETGILDDEEDDEEEGGRKPILIKSFIRLVFDLPGAGKQQRGVGVEFDMPDDATHQEMMGFVLECQREIARQRSENLNL